MVSLKTKYIIIIHHNKRIILGFAPFIAELSPSPVGPTPSNGARLFDDVAEIDGGCTSNGRLRILATPIGGNCCIMPGGGID
jgi:hypothetical protein